MPDGDIIYVYRVLNGCISEGGVRYKRGQVFKTKRRDLHLRFTNMLQLVGTEMNEQLTVAVTPQPPPVIKVPLQPTEPAEMAKTGQDAPSPTSTSVEAPVVAPMAPEKAPEAVPAASDDPVAAALAGLSLKMVHHGGGRWVVVREDTKMPIHDGYLKKTEAADLVQKAGVKR